MGYIGIMENGNCFIYLVKLDQPRLRQCFVFESSRVGSSFLTEKIERVM